MGHAKYDIALVSLTNTLDETLIVTGVSEETYDGLKVENLYAPRLHRILGRIEGVVPFPIVRIADQRASVGSGFEIPPRAKFTLIITVRISERHVGGAIRSGIRVRGGAAAVSIRGHSVTETGRTGQWRGCPASRESKSSRPAAAARSVPEGAR